MGVRSTYPHFVEERLSYLQCLPHLSLSLQVGTRSQLLVLGLF